MDTLGSSSPSVVVAAEAGNGGGEPIDPSTWIKAAQSTGEAGDAALRFFLALVITEMSFTDSAQCLSILDFQKIWEIIFKKSTYGPQIHYRWRPNFFSLLRAVLACAESHMSRISPRKRMFKKKHFKLFIRSPDGFGFMKKSQKIS